MPGKVFSSPEAPADMVEIPGGTLMMGSADHYPDERPVRPVELHPFRIDRHLVTNRRFAEFVGRTGYVTIAERPLDPSLYPDVPAERLVVGALVFVPPHKGAVADSPRDWWQYRPGACWRRPEGGKSVFAGRLDHPVTCVAYEDATAFARWAGKQLASEAEWEWAARGGLVGATYAWGEEWMPRDRPMANTWQGFFPTHDLKPKSPYRTTRIGAFPPNGYGLHDMIGNVWEWTGSWYRTGSGKAERSCCAPPQDSYDPDQPSVRIPRRVLKGGSFLCAANYCERYRPAARQPQMEDTASVHIGFRCAQPA